MDAVGDATTRRFATNTFEKGDHDRLRSIYGSDPVRDAATGGQRYTGTFGGAADGALPSEVGNRNDLVEIATRFGRTRFYYESFAESVEDEGDVPSVGRGGLWATLERRMHAGELWVRLFGRWAERGIPDPSRREAWATYVERDLIPLVNDAVLLWSAQMAAIRANRVSQTLREESDRSPMTADESFAQRIGMPALLFLTERGLLTAEEAQRVLLVSVDGNATKRERTWVVDDVLVPALVRQVHRFKPEVRKLDSAEILPMAISFWLYATTSPDRRDILLASPAISDDDKARLRNGDFRVTLPPAFGFDVLNAPRRMEAQVTLRTGSEPFAHNGAWDAATQSVAFETTYSEASRRTTLYPPVFFAAWSEPDAASQEAVFGETVLAGDALAAYAVWQCSVPKALAVQWNAALDRLEAGQAGALEEVHDLARRLDADHPLPAPLMEWLEGEIAPRTASSH